MKKIEKRDILIPLLEKYYPSEEFENEKKFYNDFFRLNQDTLGNTFLSLPFGISIIISNVVETAEICDVIYSLEKNENHFDRCIFPEEIKETDKTLFEDNTEFQFERNVFKCKEKIRTPDEDKDGKTINFSVFISAVKTNLNYSIISFILTTWDKPKDGWVWSEELYINISTNKIINILTEKSIEFIEFKLFLAHIDQTSSSLLKIDRKTFLGINFWRADWAPGLDNNIDATMCIRDNPYYYYSILTLDTNVSRRNYKNIMDYLGWCFSASRVHCGIFSKNVYISVTLKPLKERYEYIGYDGTEFRLWEILGLQYYILTKIDLIYRKCKPKCQKEANRELLSLINDLNKVYAENYFNSFLTKTGKGEIWIKFNTYLQDLLEINSYYELYVRRHQKFVEETSREDALKLTKLNTTLSILIFTTIFLTIATFLLENDNKKFYNNIIYNITSKEFEEVAIASFSYTIVVLIITLIVLFIFLLISYFLFKLLSKLLNNKLNNIKRNM
jgi:hypothetical protein